MSASFLNDDRIAELLTLEATQGLDAAERAELDRMLAAYPAADRDVLERTAASLTLAATKIEPLPDDLRAKLESAAREFCAYAAVCQRRPADAAAQEQQRWIVVCSGGQRHPGCAWLVAAHQLRS